MMELTDILTPAELTRLGMMPGEPQSLIQFRARNWLRQRNLEEESRRQAHAEECKHEQARQLQLHALHTKALAQPTTDRGFTKKQVQTLAKVLAPVIDDLEAKIDAVKAEKAATPPESVQAYIEQRFVDLQIDELKKTVETLEASAMRYRGVHKTGNRYERGEVVTLNGSWWLATRSTDARPGDGDSGWKLTVKGPPK